MDRTTRPGNPAERRDSGRKRDDEFRALWDRYGRRIACFIAQCLPTEGAHHDDIFQDVMLSIYEHRETYDRRLSFEAWAYRIARNRCIDHLRRRRASAALTEELAQTGPDAHDRVVEGEVSEAIGRALGALSPDDRQIAYLRFFEEMPFGEIARVLAMNENTVKTRMTAIKRRLRAELGAWL